MNDKNLVDISHDAIRKHGSNSEEFPDIGLFANHHKEELADEYWNEHLGTPNPTLEGILGLLVPVGLDEDNEDNEELDDDETLIDFTLPGEVTQYLLCVSLDESKQVIDISMES